MSEYKKEISWYLKIGGTYGQQSAALHLTVFKGPFGGPISKLRLSTPHDYVDLDIDELYEAAFEAKHLSEPINNDDLVTASIKAKYGVEV